MRAYRLIKAKYRDQALTGFGASYRQGARWNVPGQRAIYTSESRALAIVESLAHVPRLPGLPPQVMLSLDIPDELVERPIDAPSAADVAAARMYGAKWFEERRSVALAVISIIAPPEVNLVLNADHADFERVQLVEVVEFDVDSRLAQLLGPQDKSSSE